ncbi:hypothetical protein Tco_1363845, partial [Tanacetum coccineum]
GICNDLGCTQAKDDKQVLSARRDQEAVEIELWNLKVKGNDVPAYTERFQELTLICTKFVANETEKIDKIRDVGYGIRDTWVDPAEAVPEIAPMTVGEVNTRVVELAELHERDTQDLYALLEDAQDGRSRISQRVDMNSQQVDLLMGDRMTLQETIWMVEEEAYASREA